ncbi:hypothetical protein ACFS07_16050 [Undibacterium arcticum]
MAWTLLCVYIDRINMPVRLAVRAHQSNPQPQRERKCFFQINCLVRPQFSLSSQFTKFRAALPLSFGTAHIEHETGSRDTHQEGGKIGPMKDGYPRRRKLNSGFPVRSSPFAIPGLMADEVKKMGFMSLIKKTVLVLLISLPPGQFTPQQEPIREELFSAERMEQLASHLATEQSRVAKNPLWSEFDYPSI